PHVYATGDVKGGPAFTHISYDDFRVLRTNLLEGGDATIEGRLVPYTVFIDPQLGRVGLREKAAKEQGLDYRVAKMPMSRVARAIETEETRGFMKVLVDAQTDHILGVTILGTEGGELMSMLEIAMLGDLPCTVLRDAIFTHPLLAEAFNNLFATLSE
ncbi:MAG: FAD-containing oxidoreductase, partial [Anaerolineae bacterium]